MESSTTAPPGPYRGGDPWLNFPNEHERGQVLGKGSEGIVESWTHRPSNIVLAVKMIKARSGLPLEVQILKDLPLHPSIIRFDAFYREVLHPRTDCLLFEHCSLGDLFDFRTEILETSNATFSEAFMWSVYHQLSSALAFLHDGIGAPASIDLWKTIVHRDIKAENVLIKTFGAKKDKSSIIIKLADFGLSTFYDPKTSRMPEAWGTTMAWPPEQTWENREATPAGDIWAIGCIVHELAHGFLPLLNWRTFAKAWLTENTIPKDWSQGKKMSFYKAKTPRIVLPINVEPAKQSKDTRRTRPCPKYSDGLNECMMLALEMNMTERATAGSLNSQVEEAHASFLFEELRVQNEEIEKEMQDRSSEDQGFRGQQSQPRSISSNLSSPSALNLPRQLLLKKINIIVDCLGSTKKAPVAAMS
ncbi:kinase-like protein [Melanomma pulvis-pyrius CBS 109.77]|uniref:non-specific serine/threonine protein kinase n=1 Tax=Melanomma pulvis-pyrius CBS 109.77 TaxID=1314802 RepID=A0A6A6XHY4_9PLEO|nr:kinase-like protein [Melanomma pulvis-pyrius CBS 109.77]